ncbi:MAG TPA: hypothetical protein VHG51_01510 [Longimicrobiaceae bacterium]|nr:hypothetical protein [Longimicrobiaceae bacterium]
MILALLVPALLHATAPADSLPPLLPGLGTYAREIATSSPRAQRYFDQGLALLYGFNHAEALRAFQAAAAMDTAAPMPYVGMALAHGPYVDRARNPASDRAARQALEGATARAAAGTATERGLIAALVARYDSTRAVPEAESAYAEAMGRLQARYPRDPDLATLHGEARMLLHRRRYWRPDHTPAPGIEQGRSALEAAMALAADHPGAHHLYVHLFEAAHDPRPALPAAERLRTLAPGAGHLLHMSSHVFFRVGRYAESVEANVRAREADRRYFALARPPATSVYVSAYHAHTLHFLWVALATEGRRREALEAADSLAARVAPAAADASPYFHPWTSAPLLVHLRFGDWAEILRAPAPPPRHAYSTGVWRHARGMAHAELGSLDSAAVSLGALDSITAAFPPGTTVAPTAPGRGILRLMHLSLGARIAEARGDVPAALAQLREGVALQDSLGHMEPPGWHIPLRQTLGATLLRAGRAREAEAAFTEDLAMQPGNGWSLCGLAAALQRQGRRAEAARAHASLRRAWSRADAPASCAFPAMPIAARRADVYHVRRKSHFPHPPLP